MDNVIVWADIPVLDMDRARKFYGELIQRSVDMMPGTDEAVAVPSGGEPGQVAFDLALGENMKPSEDGPTIYISSQGDIDGMAQRAEKAGGTILQPPMDMGPFIGIICFILDTEGNRIGLQQPSNQPMPG